MGIRIDVFDRWDRFLFSLGEKDMLECLHTDELNGEDTLTITTETHLMKGYRLVWHDKRGRWHEHIVDSSTPDEQYPEIERYTCLNSIVETFGDYIDDLKPNGTATEAIQKALSPTRWKLGTITVTTTASCEYYHTSAREALQQAQENWGGELSTTIEVSGDRITARKVNLLTRRGADNGKRFVYSKDLQNVTRTIQAHDPVTRLYGYGKGEATDNGGYGRRIDFASINGGKKYVEDTQALQDWGRPDGEGGKKHHESTIIFPDCEDPRELLSLTRDALDEQKEPRVAYEANAVDLEAMGFDHEGVDTGDTVAIIDTIHKPVIRVSGRVMKIVRDLLNWEAVITLGNIIDDVSDILSSQAAILGNLESRSGNWDVAASTPSAYINQIMAGLNREFDAGASYIYQSPEQGLIIGSVPLDPVSGKPTSTPASAIQLKGGGFRIANTLNSDGTWNWRTFGTGNGFTADEITAGVIKGGSNYWNLNDGTILFKQGMITDTTGNNSWDLTNGTLKTNRMEAKDASVSGLISSQGANGDLYLRDGMVFFYSPDSELAADNDWWGIKNGKQLASISALKGEGNIETNLSLVAHDSQSQFGKGEIWLTAEKLRIHKVNDGLYTGYSGTLRFHTVTNGSETISTLKFVNGLLVG